MAQSPVHFVVFRYGHHSPHSGYSRLAEYGARQYPGGVIRVSKPLPRSLIRERMLWRLARGTPGYDRAAMAAELQVGISMLKEPPGIYHFLYGETTYHYAGYLNHFRGNRIVASFHLPLPGLQKAVQAKEHIRRLSAVICLGRTQQEFFADVMDPDRIFFAPLGVDIEYYTQPNSFEARDPNLCIFVGENYRDFPTLRGVIELMAYRRPATRFVAVLPKRSHELVGCHPNLTLLSGLPESDLLQLYQSASVVIMPLKDAVANNALLEAMACGLPVVMTDVGAVRDYVTDESAVLVPPGNARAMADAALDLLEDFDERKLLSERSREQALKFSWPVVTGQLESIYAHLS